MEKKKKQPNVGTFAQSNRKIVKRCKMDLTQALQ
jgi:hypothetical protein